MSYTKQTWQTGDVITAEKLNKLENGVAALSNYDIVFTNTINDNDEAVITADGASLEELVSGGYKKALFNVPDDGDIFENSGFSLANNENTMVRFEFVAYVGGLVLRRFAISANGVFAITAHGADGTPISTLTGTYTYSNGHYVFTPEGSGN